MAFFYYLVPVLLVFFGDYQPPDLFQNTCLKKEVSVQAGKIPLDDFVKTVEIASGVRIKIAEDVDADSMSLDLKAVIGRLEDVLSVLHAYNLEWVLTNEKEVTIMASAFGTGVLKRRGRVLRRAMSPLSKLSSLELNDKGEPVLAHGLTADEEKALQDLSCELVSLSTIRPHKSPVGMEDRNLLNFCNARDPDVKGMAYIHLLARKGVYPHIPIRESDPDPIVRIISSVLKGTRERDQAESVSALKKALLTDKDALVRTAGRIWFGIRMRTPAGSIHENMLQGMASENKGEALACALIPYVMTLSRKQNPGQPDAYVAAAAKLASRFLNEKGIVYKLFGSAGYGFLSKMDQSDLEKEFLSGKDTSGRAAGIMQIVYDATRGKYPTRPDLLKDTDPALRNAGLLWDLAEPPEEGIPDQAMALVTSANPWIRAAAAVSIGIIGRMKNARAQADLSMRQNDIRMMLAGILQYHTREKKYPDTLEIMLDERGGLDKWTIQRLKKDNAYTQYLYIKPRTGKPKEVLIVDSKPNDKNQICFGYGDGHTEAKKGKETAQAIDLVLKNPKANLAPELRQRLEALAKKCVTAIDKRPSVLDMAVFKKDPNPWLRMAGLLNIEDFGKIRQLIDADDGSLPMASCILFSKFATLKYRAKPRVEEEVLREYCMKTFRKGPACLGESAISIYFRSLKEATTLDGYRKQLPADMPEIFNRTILGLAATKFQPSFDNIRRLWQSDENLASTSKMIDAFLKENPESPNLAELYYMRGIVELMKPGKKIVLQFPREKYRNLRERVFDYNFPAAIPYLKKALAMKKGRPFQNAVRLTLAMCAYFGNRQEDLSAMLRDLKIPDISIKEISSYVKKDAAVPGEKAGTVSGKLVLSGYLVTNMRLILYQPAHKHFSAQMPKAVFNVLETILGSQKLKIDWQYTPHWLGFRNMGFNQHSVKSLYIVPVGPDGFFKAEGMIPGKYRIALLYGLSGQGDPRTVQICDYDIPEIHLNPGQQLSLGNINMCQRIRFAFPEGWTIIRDPKLDLRFNWTYPGGNGKYRYEISYGKAAASWCSYDHTVEMPSKDVRMVDGKQCISIDMKEGAYWMNVSVEDSEGRCLTKSDILKFVVAIGTYKGITVEKMKAFTDGFGKLPSIWNKGKRKENGAKHLAFYKTHKDNPLSAQQAVQTGTQVYRVEKALAGEFFRFGLSLDPSLKKKIPRNMRAGLGLDQTPAGAEIKPGNPDRLKPQKEIDKVTRRVPDLFEKDTEWLIYDKKFVGRKHEGQIRNFEEFLEVRNLDSIQVNGLDFSRDYVWAATDRGAFCYDRRSSGWVEYAVNREHIGKPVRLVKVDPDGKVIFQMTVGGTRKVYILDPATSKWTGN